MDTMPDISEMPRIVVPPAHLFRSLSAAQREAIGALASRPSCCQACEHADMDDTRWRKAYNEWALRQQYPGAVDVSALVGLVVAHCVTDAMPTVEAVRLANALVGSRGRPPALVVSDVFDWTPYLCGAARCLHAGSVPEKLVLDTRTWGAKLIRSAVTGIQLLPEADRQGVKLEHRVEIVVGSLHDREVAEKAVKEFGLDGKVPC